MATYTRTSRHGHSTAQLKVELLSQSVSGNSSKVRVSGRSIRDSGWGGTAYNTGVHWTLKSPQFPDKSGTKGFSTTGSVKWFEYTFTVKHASNGHRTLSIDMHVNNTGTSTFGGPIDISMSQALPTIPRASSPSMAGSVNAGSSIKISTNRHSPSFTHKITYKIGSRSGTISSSASTSVTWKVPMALCDQITSSTSRTCTIYCTTYDGSTKVGSTQSTHTTIKVPSSVVPDPGSVSDSEYVSAVRSKVGAYVQGQSRITLSMSGNAAAYGARITSRWIKLDGQTINGASGTTGVIRGYGSMTLSWGGKDARGRTWSASRTINVLRWNPPAMSGVRFRRATSGGTVSASGTSVRVDASTSVRSLVNGSQKNILTWKLQGKPLNSSSWTTYGSWSGTVPSYSSHHVAGTIPLSESRNVRLIVQDQFSNVVTAGVIATEEVILNIESDGIGIGKYHEGLGRLEVAGDVWVGSTRAVDSNGNGHHIDEFSDRLYLGTGDKASGPSETYLRIAKGGYVPFMLYRENVELLSIDVDGDMTLKGELKGGSVPAARITGTISTSNLPNLEQDEISDGSSVVRATSDGSGPRLYTNMVWNRTYSTAYPDSTSNRLLVITEPGTIGSLTGRISADYLPHVYSNSAADRAYFSPYPDGVGSTYLGITRPSSLTDTGLYYTRAGTQVFKVRQNGDVMLHNPSAVTSSYTAAWINGDGRLGKSASTLRVKKNVQAQDPAAMGDIFPQLYGFEMKGGDGSTRYGHIADYMATHPDQERFVVYEAETLEDGDEDPRTGTKTTERIIRPRLDEEGKQVPESIDFFGLLLAQTAALKQTVDAQAATIDALTARIDALEGKQQ